MTTELLPCPFCGDDGDKGRQTVTMMDAGRATFDRIQCRSCGAMAPELNWQARAAATTIAMPQSHSEHVALAAVLREMILWECGTSSCYDLMEKAANAITELAAAPRAPTAQPLSESDIYAALGAVNPSWWDVPGGATMAFARAIESAHGIKGEVTP